MATFSFIFLVIVGCSWFVVTTEAWLSAQRNAVPSKRLLSSVLHSTSTTIAEASSTSSSSSSSTIPSVVVISPPGGVGEVAAVKAASMGSSVRWFVVSSPSSSSSSSSNSQVLLSQDALQSIANAKGKLELAGADASSLVAGGSGSGGDDSLSALSALSQWCGTADSIVCALDTGAILTGGSDQQQQQQLQLEGEKRNVVEERARKQTWKNAIKLAAQEASKNIRGKKVAIVSVDDDDENDDSSATSTTGPAGGGLGGLLGSLLSGNSSPRIPATLTDALTTSQDDGTDVITLRHGTLLGIPESSPDFSPLVGGPRRDPVLCEEYTLRSVRLDPTFATWLSSSGTISSSSTTSKSASLLIRSSRHSVGQAAALVALDKVESSPGWDVCVTSMRGRDPVSLDGWQEEFRRISATLSSSSSSSSSAPLFVASFGSVPNVERLADWLATKWAPAVLRMYEISVIRTGARPVYATRAGPGRVEIVWQELINFDTVSTTAKMILQVSDTGLVATRELIRVGTNDYDEDDDDDNDSNDDDKTIKPSSSLSSFQKRGKPLKGENVLVRQLAEAVSQAMEKGLAEKPRPSKSTEPVGTVTSVVASGTVADEASSSVSSSSSSVVVPTTTTTTTPPPVPSIPSPPPASLESGPRAAGARRSSQRQRGSGAKKSSTTPTPPPPPEEEEEKKD